MSWSTTQKSHLVVTRCCPLLQVAELIKSALATRTAPLRELTFEPVPYMKDMMQKVGSGVGRWGGLCIMCRACMVFLCNVCMHGCLAFGPVCFIVVEKGMHVRVACTSGIAHVGQPGFGGV